MADLDGDQTTRQVFVSITPRRTANADPNESQRRFAAEQRARFETYRKLRDSSSEKQRRQNAA